MNTISKEDINNILKMPSPDIDKYAAGSVAVEGGLGGMPGALMLSTYAALRSGSGLVRALTNKEYFSEMHVFCPEVITVTPEEGLKKIDKLNAISFGPGMGLGREAHEDLEFILREGRIPLVIDADGLNLISKHKVLKKLVRDYSSEIALTPHLGEALRLLGNPDGAFHREDIAKNLYDEYGATIVLKGRGTIVYSGGEYWISPVGNQGMATGGSGDVLTGIYTSFLGKGLSSRDAGVASVYVHGLAGDMALEKKGVFGLIARDIIEFIPGAINSVLGE